MIQSVLATYAPGSLAMAFGSVTFLAAIVTFGLLAPRLPGHSGRVVAWIALPLVVVFADRLTTGEPAGFRMLAIVAGVLYAMKAIVHCVEGPLSFGRWLCFCLGWFGMRPSVFAGERRPDPIGAMRHARRGAAQFLLGVVLVFVARAIDSGTQGAWIAWPFLLAGLSFMLHFGVFLLLTAFWRWIGFQVSPLFRAPILSSSLKEFWGRRWNLAFSEMTALAIYRPLSPHTGRSRAMATAFLFSGALHEIAISLPVGSGWGWPFGYFAAHAIGMQLEARFGWASRPWTIAWVLLPLPILFHAPFRTEILAAWLH